MVKRARIPLVGSYENRNANPAAYSLDDQVFINCYPEISVNQYTRAGKAYLNKRPGTTWSSPVDSGTASASGSYAAIAWTGNSSVTAANVLSFQYANTKQVSFLSANHVSGGAGVAIGNPISALECYSLTETIISGTPNLVACVIDESSSAGAAWFYPEGGAWTKITSANFPSALVRNDPVHLDGYLFAMSTAGRIHNSDLNTLSTWGASSYIDAQSMPDNGVGLARYGDTVAAFGTQSVEFFYNAGNATGSPLSPVANSVRRVGALVATKNKTIVPVGDTIYWIGAEADSGTLGFYRIEGREPSKVSNGAIDKLLNSSQITGIVGAFTAHGMTHVMLDDGSCFCPSTGFWWRFLCNSEVPSVIVSSLGQFYFTYGKSSVQAVSDKARVVISRTDAYGDTLYSSGANTVFASEIRTSHIDFNTDLFKFWKNMRLVGDRQSARSLWYVSWFDDDYKTESNVRLLDMNSAQNRVTRMGRARRRALRLRHQDTTPARVEAVEIDYELGSK